MTRDHENQIENQGRMHITTVDSLCDAAIQGQLTIVIGSAVSLKGNIAPGVPDFIKLFLNGLTERALIVDPKSDYATYRIGKLAEQIAEYDKENIKLSKSKKRFFKNVKNTKFEELLRLCIDNGVDIEQIIKVTYKGTTDAYNLNHNALAFLANRYGITLLTTNFDLGVENAGFRNSIVPENGKWTLRDKPKVPVLAKLHGCAEKGEFVVTSERLLSMQSRQEYSFIKNWCSSGTVLFLGYSGTGDIDIAPHFDQLSDTTTMLWANNILSKPPFNHAKWVSCDLMKDDSSNLLLQLASKLEWQRPVLIPKIHLNLNEDELASEFNKISPFVAARCLVDIIGRCNPKIFLSDYIVASKLDRAPGNKEQFLSWCINRRVDPPPLRTGHNNETRWMLDRLADVPGSEIYRSVWYVFADWRTSKHTKALQGSSNLVSKEITIDIEVQLRIYEIFLAIIAERLWGSADKKDRQSVLQDYKTEIDAASNALRSRETNERQLLESYFGGQLRLHEIAFWQAVSSYEPADCNLASIAIEELIKLRNQAADLKVIGATVSIDHSLIGINTFCSRYLICTTADPSVYEKSPFAPDTIFTRKKRFAYKTRFRMFGRYVFQFLEVQMLGLWEVFSREPSLMLHTIGLRWERSKLIYKHKFKEIFK